ncbi:protein NCBP2AS2 homolog [Toxorhynchites rutilus septentrionalis]|uniref:protein NCBP2AS2 homolog n=1 Tax=Toxorhynchites rutilus septentrionalis TaxID=329112 RepID=UPI002478CA01|nr:protein NCBP2AS2 homolog [Toxorhynchites rutilus septentrionalis]
MVLRMILRYLANNEQLIQRLAESYPMRRTAQFIVSAYYRSRSIVQERKLENMTPEQFKRILKSFKDNIKQEIESTKQQTKKRD